MDVMILVESSVVKVKEDGRCEVVRENRRLMKEVW